MLDHSQNRRTSLLGGLLLFTGATTAIWLGRHIAILCVGRFLQGFAGASIWSVGLALIIDTVGSKDVAETMGYANLAFTSGYMAGPTVGGVVYAAGGHHAVFSLAVGLLGLDMLLRLLIIEKKDAKEVLRAYHEEEDEDGGAAARPLLDDRGKCCCWPFGLISRLNQCLPLSANLVFFPCLDRSSSSTAQPPASREFAYQSLITSKRLLISLVCAFMQAFLVTSFEATLPLRLRELFNFGSAEAGLTFIALLLPSILATPIGKTVLSWQLRTNQLKEHEKHWLVTQLERIASFFLLIICCCVFLGYICNKFGNRQIAALGYVVCGVATILLRLPKNNDIPSKVGLIADLAFIGTSMCAVMTPVLTEVFVSVEDLEEQKPGRFGPFGAFAQAVRGFRMPPFPP